MKRPFQLAGKLSAKALPYWQWSTGLICELTWPATTQYAGSPGVDPAGTLSATTMTVLGTGNPEAGSVARLAHGVGVAGAPIDVVVVLKPAH
jgi:hypothetical protein